MTDPAPAAARDAGPPSGPPRRRPSWPRRHPFTTTVLALLAFALLLRLVWGWHSARQLAAALEDIRRRGHPTTASEIVDRPVPDAENAWLVHARAIAALKKGVDSPRATILEYPSYPPYGPEWEGLAEASEKENRGAFPFARRARQLPNAQFPLEAQDRTRAKSTHWQNARRLANTLADGAEYAHHRGDDAEAVERLLDVLHLGRSLRQDRALISQLVGLGFDAIAVDAAQKVVPTLRLDAAGGGTPASPEQARTLIAALLNERGLHESFGASLRHERVVMLDVLRDSSRNTWAIRPLADRTALRWLRDMQQVFDAGDLGNAADARRMLKELEARETSTDSAMFGNRAAGIDFPRYSRWFEPYGGPDSLGRSIETFYRDSAERRATAIIVAARLYRHDTGRWPDDAPVLVPKYMDAIPADPFRADGQPLGYLMQRGVLPDGGDRPLVIIEAGDGPEPDGDFIDTEPMYGWQQDLRSEVSGRREIRQFRDVSFWTPKKRRFDEYRDSAAEAVDHDRDEPDAPGNDQQQNGAADGPPKQ